MIVKRAQIRHAIYATWIPEALAVVVIAYCFLIEIPASIQVLFALSVSLFISMVERLQAHQEFVRDQALAQIWGEQLTLRLAVNKILQQAGEGQQLGANWQDAAAAAAKDIKTEHEEDRIFDRMADMTGIEPFIYITLHVLLFAGRIVLAVGLALALETFAPSLARQITFQ